MSFIGRLFRRAQKLPLEQVGSALAMILERARDLGEYRAELVRAAQRGDLDGPFHAFQAANRRARDYIENG